MTAHQQHFFPPPLPRLQKRAVRICVYVFKDKTENTIINYCEMCFVSVFHRRPGISFEVRRLDGKARDRRGWEPEWGEGGVAPSCIQACITVWFPGDVKCDGACTIRSCSLAQRKKKKKISFIVVGRGGPVVIVAVVLICTIYNLCCAGSAFYFTDGDINKH